MFAGQGSALHPPAVVEGTRAAAVCPTLWQRPDPAARAGDGMLVHASATPRHVCLNHEQGWLQHRDMPCHEIKQEQSPRVAAGQKIGFHSCFCKRQFIQLPPHPALAAHDSSGLLPPASQMISFQRVIE